MKKIIIKTNVAREVLDRYNAIMEKDEDPYVISADYIGDCSEGILRDTAWDENGKKTPDEYVVDAAYLIGEVEWNIGNKECDMARDAYHFGEITRGQMYYILRRNAKTIEDFKKFVAGYAEVTPWPVGEIDGHDD